MARRLRSQSRGGGGGVVPGWRWRSRPAIIFVSRIKRGEIDNGGSSGHFTVTDSVDSAAAAFFSTTATTAAGAAAAAATEGNNASGGRPHSRWVSADEGGGEERDGVGGCDWRKAGHRAGAEGGRV